MDGKIFRVLNKVEEILITRHRFVHELSINYNMTKEIYLRYISTIEITIALILESLKSKGMYINTDY